MGFAPPQPALTGDALQWVTDHDGYTFTTAGNGDEYRALISNYPYIAEAMGYGSLDAGVRIGAGGIWDKIDAAEELGYVAAVAVPSDQPASGDTGRSYYATAEATNTYGAKVAHCCWLEVSGAVPWSLADYDLAHLQRILDPDELFESTHGVPEWDRPGQPPYAKQEILCDHSPKEAYDLAVAQLGPFTTKYEFLEKLVVFGETYEHGGSSNSRVLSQWETDKTTGGCGQMSILLSAVCRSVNISPRWYTGKWISGLHATLVAMLDSTVGHVFFHGDDFYDPRWDYARGFRRTELFSVWDPLVGQEEDVDVSAFNAGRLAALRLGRFGFEGAALVFPHTPGGVDGWVDMLSQGGSYAEWKPPYLTVQEQASIYDSLVAATKVTGLPVKPTILTTGTSGALDPVSGPVTMDWLDTSINIYEDKDITGGGLIIPGTGGTRQVVIRNCKIDGNGGLGIDFTSNAIVSFENCEFTNCTTAISGVPRIVWNCHMYDNTDSAILLDDAPFSGLNDCFFVGNLIDSGASDRAVHITTGSTQDVYFVANTITSTATIPLILIDGSVAGEMQFSRNWIDGGNYCLLQNRSTSDGFYVDYNHFGRNASTGLHSSVAGADPAWVGNTYEDDDSVALIGDTAPL